MTCTSERMWFRLPAVCAVLIPFLLFGFTAFAQSGDVSAPGQFETSVYASPPEVNYPACLTASASGYVFVGVDPEGSLGTDGKPKGKILRLKDTNGDGKADEIKTFAKLNHPRGLVYDHGKLWVLHPPKMTLFHDKDRDGSPDAKQTLMAGVSSEWIRKRGVDHTVNGMQMGIDGWLYIAVGDFGLQNTKAADGTKIHKRGGGVIRIRPDGSNMEVYCWELRNPYDVGIDPYVNLFTRGNTNDGEGWNVRVSHLMQSARYGYPARYSDFPRELMPPLGQYGGGSGAGVLYLHDLRWPEPYNDALYTADWGTGNVYLHHLEPQGPTFQPDQQSFLSLSKPTDLDVDGAGRLYVSSWKNGGFDYSDENVGYVAMVTPRDFEPKPPVDVDEASTEELVEALSSPSAKQRLQAQRALLRRGRGGDVSQRLEELASDDSQPRYARVAAVYTLKQLLGTGSHSTLEQLASHETIKASVLRALTDRKREARNVSTNLFVEALESSDLKVRAQAIIGLGRLEANRVASELLPYTERKHGELPTREPVHAQPDPGRVIPHLAVRALVEMKAVDTCLDALGGPHSDGALRVLRRIHRPEVVRSLINAYRSAGDSALQKGILTALIRLYHREKPYTGGWWQTTPNPDGPYAEPTTWRASQAIARTLQTVMQNGDQQLRTHVEEQLQRHDVTIN